jgi:hypothetical protein
MTVRFWESEFSYDKIVAWPAVEQQGGGVCRLADRQLKFAAGNIRALLKNKGVIHEKNIRPGYFLGCDDGGRTSLCYEGSML